MKKRLIVFLFVFTLGLIGCNIDVSESSFNTKNFDNLSSEIIEVDEVLTIDNNQDLKKLVKVDRTE